MLQIGHRGRVRRAELEEALRTGRDRDPTGLMLSLKRYVERDLAIALLQATAQQPVCVAYLDMNGLKTINDAAGHDEGDRAIKRYLETISNGLREGMEAYRGDGGDEVVVIMRATAIEIARQCFRAILEQLAKEEVSLPQGVRKPLSASCGICCAERADAVPKEVLKRADQAQMRAKGVSRLGHRPSVLAVMEESPETVGDPTAPAQSQP